MSTNLQKRRSAIIEWILRRDTVLMEFALGISALMNAIQVSTVEGGKSLAPFLFSALTSLQFAGSAWILALTLYGILSLLTLLIGLTTGNTFLLRGIVALYGCVVWTAVAVAVLTSEQNFIIGFRYGFTAFLASVVAFILWTKHDFKVHAPKGGVHAK